MSCLMLHPEVLEILRCPETMQKLALAPSELLERAAASAANGMKRNGSQFTGRLAAGLVREDGKVLYPVCNGIPMLMIEEAIAIPPNS